MNSVRYTLIVILVVIFSWPVVMQEYFSLWFNWLYPFVIWAIAILAAIKFDNKRILLDDDQQSDEQ